jgi:hypothetical protein
VTPKSQMMAWGVSRASLPCGFSFGSIWRVCGSRNLIDAAAAILPVCDCAIRDREITVQAMHKHAKTGAHGSLKPTLSVSV